MTKNYLMKLTSKRGGEIYFNPLHVTSFMYDWYGDGGDVVIRVWTTESEHGAPVEEEDEEVAKEFNRALNAMFSELGQQLKDASIYDIQHRR